MTIEIKKFILPHLDGFQPRDIIADFNLTMAQNDMNSSLDMISLFNGDDLICFAGINHLRIGVGEVWLIVSDKIDECKFNFFKTVRGLVEFCLQKFGLHRVELAVVNDWKEGHKWAKALGFTQESVAKNYDFNMVDHAIYVRFE